MLQAENKLIYKFIIFLQCFFCTQAFFHVSLKLYDLRINLLILILNTIIHNPKIIKYTNYFIVIYLLVFTIHYRVRRIF